MGAKKQSGAGGTRLISKDSTENPKLGAKALSDGRESLYLDFYYGYEMVYDEKKGKDVPCKRRERKSLKLYLWQAPRTPIERQQNKEVLDLAKRIRFEREQELLEDMEGYRLKKDVKVDFIQYYNNYLSDYTKSDKRILKLALSRFTDFLRDTPEYKKYQNGILIECLDKDMMVAFTEYLQSRSKGEGANTLYKRFKKVIRHAIDHKVIPIDKDPCKGIIIKVDSNTLSKDVLSPEEITKLLNTNHPEQNQDIRRAFIFCMYTGMRFCDVSKVTYRAVDYSNKTLKFRQSKTEGHSTRSGVTTPLNDGLLTLIGEPSEGEDLDSLIFPLPSYWMCIKSLRRWVERAGINKHITWHCARHSFATNLVANGANIVTTSNLMGHSSLKYTEKYTRAVDKLKEDAINSLPELNF